MKTVSHVGVAIGLITGLVLGALAAATGSPVLLRVAAGVAPVGTAFMNAIQMVVVPLVVVVIFVGVARLGDPRKLGRLGGWSLGFWWLTTFPAILIGMGLMKVGLSFAPPIAMPEVPEQATPEIPGMIDFLLRLIPANPFAAAAQGALLPLIVFTVLLAAAAGTLAEDQRGRLVRLAEALSDALIRLVHWVLWTAPVGVFALAAPVTARTGWAMLQSLAVFIVTVVLGLFVFKALVYLPAVRYLGRMKVSRFVTGTLGTYALGFSTTSSVATLPMMLEEADEKLKLSPEVANLVIPLGASLNRAGSALFQGASIVFLASLFDVTIPVASLVGVVFATFLVAMTVAPVPSAGVMTLAPALDTAGVPLGGMAILLGVDRIPDMFRSATNMIGHMVAAVIVDARVGTDGKAPDGASTNRAPPDRASPDRGSTDREATDRASSDREGDGVPLTVEGGGSRVTLG